MANKLIICGDEQNKAEIDSIQGLEIQIDNGDNNIIQIFEPYNFTNFTIRINGSENKIEIGKNAIISNSTVDMGVSMVRRTVKIGEFCRLTDSILSLPETDDLLTIGNHCVIKQKNHIRCDDGHTIFDIDSGEVINRGGKVILGDNVFVGQHSYIGKNVVISNNVVIMPCSVVTKGVEKSNIMAGGNPAKIVRENISFELLK